jgi:hypothetical protein
MTSRFIHPNPEEAMDFSKAIQELDLSTEEKEALEKTLQSYLDMMSKT